jgi:hypothetical protein
MLAKREAAADVAGRIAREYSARSGRQATVLVP